MEQVLYQLPEGWEWLSFDSLVENLDGKRIPVKTSERSKEYAIYPYYGATGIIDYVDDYIYEGEKLLISEDGANLVARKYPIAFLADGKYWVNNHAHVVDAYKDKISNKYLSYFFSVLDLSSFITGSAQPKLSQKKLNSIKIAVAPITEQKHIVEKLDALLSRIDNAVEHLQESITLADALFKSSLSSMLCKQEHWDKVRLNDVCQITSKLCDPREEEYLDMFHIGGANITSVSGELIGLKTAREEKLISGKFPFDNSMVLYNKIRPYLMKVARPSISGICSADIYPLTPDSQKMTRDFLFYLLLSDQFTQYAIEGSSRAGMPKVNRSHLFNFEFYLPPIDEQKTICESLDSLVKKTNEVSKELVNKLSFFTVLKASILDSAFKGEL